MSTVAFAGPLCRWFAGAAGTAAALVPGVLHWQRDVLAALAGKPRLPQPWREDAAAEYRQHDLDAAGLPALRLFACYAEHPDLDLPDTVPAPLELDRHWRTAADAKFATSRYGQLLAPQLWLPGDFPFTFRVPLPDGSDGEIGCVTGLEAQLQRLNQHAFQADAAAIASWSRLPAPGGGNLLDAARRGFAGLLAAAAFARRQALPLAVGER